MKQSSTATNPLRISHESLDLDDIISDLNEGNFKSQQETQSQSTIQKQISENTKTTTTTGLNPKQKQSASSLVKTQSKTKITNNKENNSKVTNQAQANKNNLAVNGMTAQINDTTKMSVIANNSTQMESDKKQKDYLISTTSESHSERPLYTHEEHKYTNDSHRNISDSNFKFDSVSQVYSHTLADDQQSLMHRGQQNLTMMDGPNSQPFYLNRGNISQASGITDEDVESFQKKLDTLIINFRSETITEFMKTKKQVLQEQNQTIDAERRRCNTLLGVKQNQIEQLKENLGQKTKMCDELSIRCEIMALWAGKGKTLARMKVLQFKCFNALKEYREFKKHSKNVLKHKLEEFKANMKRKAFLGWEKQYKEWKIVKNKDDFEKAVKTELQHICAQYSKEIESLRTKLDEANSIVEQENKNKAMMQENLKKAFMRGVCALNFEAMNILNPNDVNYQNQIEREMEKQVMYAMNDINNNTSVTQGVNHQQFQHISQNQTMNQRVVEINRSPQQNLGTQFSQRFNDQSFQNSNSYQYSQSDINDQYQTERKIMQIEPNSDLDYKKVETKDSLWKPAPIMGREITQSINTIQQPQITQMLKQTGANQQQNYVLPSHFNRVNNSQITNSNTMNTGQPQFSDINQTSQSQLYGYGNDNFSAAQTDINTLYNQQLNYQSSSLPDFVSQNNIGGSSLPQVNGSGLGQTEGKTIYATANQNLSQPQVNSIKSSSQIGGSSIGIGKSVAVNQTTKKGNVQSTLGKNNGKTTK